jgi:hypothetical protein
MYWQFKQKVSSSFLPLHIPISARYFSCSGVVSTNVGDALMFSGQLAHPHEREQYSRPNLQAISNLFLVLHYGVNGDVRVEKGITVFHNNGIIPLWMIGVIAIGI